jgi:hypothetical protein
MMSQVSVPMFHTFYDTPVIDEAAAKAAADAKAIEDAKAADPTKIGAVRTYSEDEFQKAIEREKAAAAEATRKAVTELESHKKNANLTQAEKDNLQKKIDELNLTVMTKEQLFKQDREKLISTYEAAQANVQKERDEWKTRFVDSTVQRSIRDAAVEYDAYDPDVFLDMLGPKTQVVEDRADDGTVRGFKVKVKLTDTDPKTGVESVLDLDPKLAVKQLKEREKYGYLFKGYTNAGVGGAGSQQVRPADYDNIQPGDYAKNRAAIMQALS